MTKIKHVSFDFWGTLYWNSTEFKAHRNLKISELLRIEPELVQSTLTEVQADCDAFGEKFLVGVPAYKQIELFLQKVSPKETHIQNTATKIVEVERTIWAAFLEFPPIPLYDMKLFGELKRLRVTTSISCNTGYISGQNIYVAKMNTATPKFDFELYSDQIGHFKPSTMFAHIIKSHIKSISHTRATEYDEILHIGDNADTDGKLCEVSGMKLYIIEAGTLSQHTDQILKIVRGEE